MKEEGPYAGTNPQEERERERDEKRARAFREKFERKGLRPGSTAHEEARKTDDERAERFRESLKQEVDKDV